MDTKMCKLDLSLNKSKIVVRNMVNGWCSPLEMEVNSYNGGPLNLKWMFSFVCVVNWTHNMSLLLLPLKVLVLLMCVGPHYLSTSCAAFNSFATLLKARCTVFHCFNKLLRGGLSTVTMEHLSRNFFFLTVLVLPLSF
jgi:hypothetical protein